MLKKQIPVNTCVEKQNVPECGTLWHLYLMTWHKWTSRLIAIPGPPHYTSTSVLQIVSLLKHFLPAFQRHHTLSFPLISTLMFSVSIFLLSLLVTSSNGGIAWALLSDYSYMFSLGRFIQSCGFNNASLFKPPKFLPSVSISGLTSGPTLPTSCRRFLPGTSHGKLSSIGLKSHSLIQ